MLKIKIKGLTDKQLMPTRKHKGDLCFDIKSPRPFILRPGFTKIIDTKLIMLLPNNYSAIIKCKSKLAIKGIEIRGGVIDYGYNKTWKIIISNVSEETIKFDKYDNIAQFYLQKNEDILFEYNGKVYNTTSNQYRWI